MSCLAIKQINIIVNNTDCMRARVRTPSMAWRASFPRSRLPASVEFFNKATMCDCCEAIREKTEYGKLE